MSNTELLKTIWQAVYSLEKDLKTVFEDYFHPAYKQCINGVEMNLDEYLLHVQEQKQLMKVDAIEYRHIMEKDDELFALYYPKGKNNDNAEVEAEVIAYFKFKENKLLSIHGQVRLIKGQLSDVDM